MSSSTELVASSKSISVQNIPPEMETATLLTPSATDSTRNQSKSDASDEESGNSGAGNLCSTEPPLDSQDPANLSDEGTSSAFAVEMRNESGIVARKSGRETQYPDFLRSSLPTTKPETHAIDNNGNTSHLSPASPSPDSPPPISAVASDVHALPKKKPSIVGVLTFRRKKKTTTTTKKKESILGEFHCVALWNCTADAENELSFAKGDRLRVIDSKHEDKGWLLAELGGKTGLIPRNYVRKLL